MVSLPSDIYYVYQQTKNECFNRLKKRVPYISNIFDYECIDIIIYGDDHFSRVFVMNALKALEKGTTKNDDTDHIASMLLCNWSNLFGVHTIKEVSQFVIQFLNYVRRNLLNGNKKYATTTEVQQFRQFLRINSTSND